MTSSVSFQHVGKQYRLGRVGTGTLSHDLNRWWQTVVLRRDDPYLRMGEVNDRSRSGHSDYVWALRDVSFDVAQGEVVGIIGRNGAGKSTLLKLLSQITAPSTGRITYRGRIGSLLEVGTGFHPEMTGRENVYMNGSILGMTRHEITALLDEIVDFAGVERFLDTPVKRYSSGMVVRLGFAVAAFLNPDILVVDEVLTVGDAEFQRKAVGKLDSVARGEGRTVLFVSHNMAAVRNLCTRGMVFDQGAMIFDGGVHEAIDAYMSFSLDATRWLDVAQMPRSRGNGAIRFNSIAYLDAEGRPATPVTGRPLRMHIGLEVRTERLLECNLSVEIRDKFSQPMIYCPSQFSLPSFALDRGQHYVDLDIPRLPLTQGTYRIVLWAESGSVCCDFLDCTIALEVDEGDYYARGGEVGPHLKEKIVFIDHTWTIC